MTRNTPNQRNVRGDAKRSLADCKSKSNAEINIDLPIKFGLLVRDFA